MNADTKFTVKVSMTATNRKKFTEDGEFDMLDDIAHSFRENEDASYAITTKNGMVLSNHKSFKLSKSVAIEADDNKILKMHDAWNEMHEFLKFVLNIEAEQEKTAALNNMTIRDVTRAQMQIRNRQYENN